MRKIHHGEHGAGRTMLKHMKDNNMQDVVMYVVGYYSGQHIGRICFHLGGLILLSQSILNMLFTYSCRLQQAKLK